MILRNYNENDIDEIAKLFFDTVHNINEKDYTQPQLNVWANGNIDRELWNKLFSQHDTIIACTYNTTNANIIGFGDMDSTGYLDKLYVHKDYQRQGIATKIVTQLQQNATSNGVSTFTTYASITAIPFFASLGYSIIRENIVVKNDIELKNFLMEKNS